jgi:hypothetical protein
LNRNSGAVPDLFRPARFCVPIAVENFVESFRKAKKKNPPIGLVKSHPALIEFITLFFSILIFLKDIPAAA